MDRIRAVFLDVGWTLAYPETSIWEIFADLCTEAGVATTARACENVVRSMWEVGQAHAERQFYAGATYSDSDAEFAGIFEQLGAILFAQLGVGGDHLGLVRRFLERFWSESNWVAFPEVHAGLDALRQRGMRIGVLSNAPSDLPVFLERLGITPLLDFTVVSAVEGVKKPDRRIFDIALSRAGVEPAAALHVGDMYVEDILGGRAAGLRTLLMERGDRALFPSFSEAQSRNLDPGSVVRDLTTVLARLV
jgi:putative hydrolase of the HAD superfamily